MFFADTRGPLNQFRVRVQPVHQAAAGDRKTGPISAEAVIGLVAVVVCRIACGSMHRGLMRK